MSPYLKDGLSLYSDYSVIGSGAVVQNDVTLGTSCDIGDGVVLWDNCVLQNSCTIGDDAVLQSRVQVGAGATIDGGLHVAQDSTVSASAHLTNGIVALRLAGGGTSFGNASDESSWSEEAGAVGTLVDVGPPTIPGTITTVEPTSWDNPPTGGWGDLYLDIGTDVALGHDYCEEVFDCIGFSEALQNQLAAIFDDSTQVYPLTTFTCVNLLNPDYVWCWFMGVEKYYWGHALTDIHWPDGKVTWVDGQYAYYGGVDLWTDVMDGNDDGLIQYAEGFDPPNPTDGDAKIRVYESRAAAEAAGERVWDQGG